MFSVFWTVLSMSSVTYWEYLRNTKTLSILSHNSLNLLSPRKAWRPTPECLIAPLPLKGAVMLPFIVATLWEFQDPTYLLHTGLWWCQTFSIYSNNMPTDFLRCLQTFTFSSATCEVRGWVYKTKVTRQSGSWTLVPPHLWTLLAWQYYSGEQQTNMYLNMHLFL